ncbi:MAG: 30S ribosomal protein S12 methylthiotransferase RimO, partial [Acidimicrobiia bacterium]
LVADGLVPASSPEDADLLVVNTCAFIDAAREESIDVALALSGSRKAGARLVVTGCMAERYGDELAEALPEADAVVGFAGEGSIASVVAGLGTRGTRRAQPQAPAIVHLGRKPVGVRDLLELPRLPSSTPWAYLKVAEGCDRVCAFCSIPTFRGAQRSRTPEAIFDEARGLVLGGSVEIVLVAQDLASYGRDAGAPGSLAALLRRLDSLTGEGLERLRLLYLYPSQVRDPLVATMLELGSVVPYFDLSLQHASGPLLRRMARWGSGERFLAIIESIRQRCPEATFRSSFIFGFPGETEDDHDELLGFLEAASLDWAGLFSFSSEDGTSASAMSEHVPREITLERLAEAGEIQDRITAGLRGALVGETIEVMVDVVETEAKARRSAKASPARVVGRSHREAPEIDGVVLIEGAAGDVRAGDLLTVRVTGVEGPDLEATALRELSGAREWSR